MQTLKKRPPRRPSVSKRSGFWGQNLRKIHLKSAQSDQKKSGLMLLTALVAT
jgi:hypothetical protein